ncbi:MAG: DMT family transporter [Rhizobiaceae bacterium]|nr:DMT family transporter [Rhizobiaceae bacterium]MCV0408683.1 DMT family transporter [Rhizobiaceae bacterium]
MQALRHRRENAATLGVLVMLFGIFVFVVNDTLGKWLVQSFAIGQVLFMRSAAALLVLVIIMRGKGVRQAIRAEKPGMQALRAILATVEVIAFYGAVMFLPLADTMAFWLAAPLYVAALSPFVLGEHVGWRRWTAIIVGFIGVLIVLRPSGDSFTVPAFIAVGGSLAFALMMLTARSLRGTPDKTLSFWQTIAALIGGAALAPFGWAMPSLVDFLLLGILGLLAMFAHICVTRAFKLADAATVAPLQYTMLIWAALFGYLVFGDVPRPAMILGSLIIIASGLFVFFRERRQDRQAVATQL